MSDVAGYAGLDDERRRDLDQAMYVGLSRTRHQMLGDHGDRVLDRVEVERLLVMETTKAFDRAVADARSADFTWEQIAQRVPGLVKTHGPRAAERLFEMVAAVGFSLGERYARWRCGECEGLLRDYGPYGGHPVDSEPGHREDCHRHAAAVRVHEASLEADDQPAPGNMRAISEDISRLVPRVEPVEIEGPGLGL